MTNLLLLILLIAGLAWALDRWLRGPSMAAFDGGLEAPHVRRFPAVTDPEGVAQRQAVLDSLGQARSLLRGQPRSKHLGILRKYLDEMGTAKPHDARFVPVDAAGVAAEWVLAPGANPARRMLYIHGGAFATGSRLSHRTITTEFSRLTGGAVLAIDYRLMPEHPRLAGLEDCRTAYRWMLDHGPDGAGAASTVFVAGDSAGGNLALSLAIWVRDQRLRAPDALVALSPATDGSLRSPSLRRNVRTDAMLGPLLGPLTRVPGPVIRFAGWMMTRLRPCDPRVSPLFADLGGLPPTLIQACADEMLLDDSVRFAHRAVRAGSPVRLQVWGGLVHVWHIFHPELAQAGAAYAEIAGFLADVAPDRVRS